MIVLAVDPGTMTGWASLDTKDDPLTPPKVGQLPWEDFQTMVWDQYQDRIDVQLVIERFVLNTGSMKKSRDGIHHAIQTIGVLEFIRRTRGWPTATYQLPADVMRIVDNKVLRSLGWFARGLEHGNDALRHATVWSLKQGRLTRKDLHPT